MGDANDAAYHSKHSARIGFFNLRALTAKREESRTQDLYEKCNHRALIRCVCPQSVQSAVVDLKSLRLKKEGHPVAQIGDMVSLPSAAVVTQEEPKKPFCYFETRKEYHIQTGHWGTCQARLSRVLTTAVPLPVLVVCYPCSWDMVMLSKE